MTRRRHSFPAERFRRRTEWCRTVEAITLAANTNYVTYDLLADFKGVGGVQQGATVVRNHLRLSVTSAVAAGDRWNFGVLVGQNTDIGANIAGAPEPFHDHYEDWMFWSQQTACFDGGGGSFYWPNSSNVIDVDIKSKRKLEQLQEVLNLVVYRDTVTAATLAVTISNSTLIMLP